MARNSEWVMMGGGPGEVAYCQRCGDGLRLGLPMDVTVFLAASKAFVKAHSRCQSGGYKEKVPTTPVEWSVGRDTGTSSLTICSVLGGIPLTDRLADVPHDPADFGRCHRLLQLFPAWIPQLEKVAKAYPKWAGLIEHWQELTVLYLEELPAGSSPKLYERMKDIVKESVSA